MKDSKDTPPPTIAELWGRLQDDLETSSVFSNSVKDRLGYVESIQSLRQQLSQIANTVPDSGGQSSIFAIDGGTLLIENTVDRLRHDNAETLSEFIAACGFWLWELQQRGKEAKGE